MSTLVFDIETVGEDWNDMDETTQHMLTRSVRREMMDNDEAYEAALKDIREGLGFSALSGRIVALGVYDAEKEKGVVYYDPQDKKEKEEEENDITLKPASEKEMLAQFWKGAKEYDRFVGFNSRAFDVPFMITRSAVNDVVPTKNLMRSRYAYQQSSDARHVDLMDELTFYGAVWRQKGSLHMWCRAFGIESPKAGGTTGDDVAALWKAGESKTIARYNGGDLRATKALYDKWHKYFVS